MSYDRRAGITYKVETKLSGHRISLEKGHLVIRGLSEADAEQLSKVLGAALGQSTYTADSEREVPGSPADRNR